MKIAYATNFDARDPSNPNNWAGIGYYIPTSLARQSLEIDYIGPLANNLALQAMGKIKRHYHQLATGQSYLKLLDPLFLQDYARQVARSLAASDADIVLSATIAPIAHLNCDRPLVFWADATFKNLLDFYPQFTGLCAETLRHGHAMERAALERCQLAIYSSDWAAQTAIDYYHAEPNKVKVVPFGANIDTQRSPDEIQAAIAARPADKCKLLFLGVDWVRKGGDVALAVAERLNDLGLNTEITFVGAKPPPDLPLPAFVKSLGFISKSATGQQQLSQLIADAHFLILPSLADCTPIVFCEANSLGVPCLSHQVGGIPTLIKNGVNGKLFDRDCDVNEYCDYILYLFSDYRRYQNLALSAFREYEYRLNWRVSAQKVKDLLWSLF